MDINAIEKLAAIFKDAGLTKMELSEGEFSLKFERSEANVPSVRIIREEPREESGEKGGCDDNLTVRNPVSGEKTEKTPKIPDGGSFDATKPVKSPLAGIFYSSASPDGEPYVRVGDNVRRGDVLCIIEAMKVMNEITSDCDGEISEICAENEAIVEYGQVLFRIK